MVESIGLKELSIVVHAYNHSSLGRLKQENCCELKANLEYIMGFRPVWAIKYDLEKKKMWEVGGNCNMSFDKMEDTKEKKRSRGG